MTDTFTHWRSPYIEQLSTNNGSPNYRWEMDIRQVAEALRRITGGTSTPTITDHPSNKNNSILDTTVTLPAPLHGVTSTYYYYSSSSSSSHGLNRFGRKRKGSIRQVSYLVSSSPPRDVPL